MLKFNFKGWSFSCQQFGPVLDALCLASSSPLVYWPAFVYTTRELKKQARLSPLIPEGEQEVQE